MSTSLARRIHDVSSLHGTFTLRSGTTSDRYFDKYRFEADPQLLREIAEAMQSIVPAGTEALAGLELGGVPIATILSQVTGLPTLFVRKQAKTYGTCRYAEGGEVSGRHLLVVEDIVTSGGQVIESVRALRSDGAVITDVVCVIDREAGGRAALAAEGLALHALYTRGELAAAATATA